MRKYESLREWLVVAFLVVQGLDGTLTYLGLRLTPWSEGNFLIVATMELTGSIGLSLLAWKLWASAFGIILYFLDHWSVVPAFLVLTFIYAYWGVLRWLFILTQTAPS